MFNLGHHDSVRDLLQKPSEYFEKHRVFQVMVGNPRSLQVPTLTDLALLKTRHPEIEVIVHASYPVNLCKSPSDKISVASLHYLIMFAKALDAVGVKRLVTHVGSRSKDVDPRMSAAYLWDSCQKWLMSTDECSTKLCLECDSGSKSNTRMGHMKVLDKVIRKCDDPRIRMTYDCEHAYAAGFDFDTIDQYMDLIEVVHLNSIPEYVEFGGHLDRHTSTTFVESKVPINVYLDKFKDRDIPMVQEIDPDLVEQNYTWIEEEYNAKSGG